MSLMYTDIYEFLSDFPDLQFHDNIRSQHTECLKIPYTLQSPPPPDTAPPFTTSTQIPPPIFKSQIGFFLVIYDSFHRRFPNIAAFWSVPRMAVLGGLTVYNRNI